MAPRRPARGRPARPRPRARPESKPPAQRPPATMSQAEYARHRGVSRVAVSKAVRQGRIPVDRKGRLDPALADAAWDQNTLPPVPEPALPLTLSNGQPLTYANARAMHEYYKAELAKLELGERSGQLVPLADVRDVAFRASRAARDLLDSIPDRAAEVVTGLTDPEQVRALLRKEILDVEGELSMRELGGVAEGEGAA